MYQFLLRWAALAQKHKHPSASFVLCACFGLGDLSSRHSWTRILFDLIGPHEFCFLGRAGATNVFCVVRHKHFKSLKKRDGRLTEWGRFWRFGRCARSGHFWHDCFYFGQHFQSFAYNNHQSFFCFRAVWVVWCVGNRIDMCSIQIPENIILNLKTLFRSWSSRDVQKANRFQKCSSHVEIDYMVVDAISC